MCLGKYRSALLPIFVVMILSLSSCSSDSSPTPTPTVVASPTATSVPPTPTPDTSVTEVIHVTDQDGYTFDIEYTYQLHGIEKSIANDKPGYSSAIMDLSLEISVTNTTPGRDIEFRSAVGNYVWQQPMIVIVANWSPSHPVCRTVGYSNSQNCYIWLGHAVFSGTLRAGETKQLTVTNGLYNEMPGNQPGIANIPEGSYDSVVAGLESPSIDVIYTSQSSMSRFETVCGHQFVSVYMPLTTSECFDDSWLTHPK